MKITSSRACNILIDLTVACDVSKLEVSFTICPLFFPPISWAGWAYFSPISFPLKQDTSSRQLLISDTLPNLKAFSIIHIARFMTTFNIILEKQVLVMVPYVRSDLDSCNRGFLVFNLSWWLPWPRTYLDRPGLPLNLKVGS